MSASFYDLLRYAKTGIASAGLTSADKQRALAIAGGGGGAERTITGTPPLSFTAKEAGYLTDWTITGATHEGGTKCGDRTRNLFDGTYVNYIIQNDTFRFISTPNAKCAIIPVEPSTQYTLHKIDSSNRHNIAQCSSYPQNGDYLTRIQQGTTPNPRTFTTAADTHYLVVYVSTGSESAEPRMMLNTGDEAREYEPYGYVISGACGGRAFKIYLDSPLGDGETVSQADTGVQIYAAEDANRLLTLTLVPPSEISLTGKISL